MSSAGTAYVDIEAKLDSLASDVDAAISAIDTQTIDIDAVADTSTAQADIDSVEGGSTEIAVEANTEQAQANIDDLSGSITAAGDAAGLSGGAVGGFGSEIAGLAGASTGLTAGLSLVAGGMVMAGNAAADAQVVTAETDAILGNLGSSAVTTADHISDLSQRIMEYSGFSDEAVASGANTLLMFDQINNEATFDRALEGATDLARRMGTDVPQAARMLGIALQDPEAGMNRLRRAGIVLSDAQKEQIAAFMAVGDTASAQGVILDSLEGRIGNVAEAYGETARGGMDQAREAMDELAETAGASLLPVMDAISASVIDQIDRLNSWDDALNGALLSGPLQAMFGSGGTLDGAGTVIGRLPAALQSATDGTEEFAAASGMAKDEIDGLSNALSGYLDGAFALPEAQRNLRDSFQNLFGVLLTEGHSADDVAASLEDIAYRTADVGAASGNFAVSADLTITRLRQMRDAGQISADQFNRVRDAIRGAQDEAPLTVPTSAPGATAATQEIKGVGEAAGKVPPMTYAGVQARGAAQAFADVDRVKRQLEAIDGKTYTSYVGVVTTGSAQVREHGGPVEAGMPYIVGEKRPELFVPTRNGTILPSVPSSMNGATYNVTVNAPTGNGDDIARAVTDAIRQLERAGR